MEDEKQKLKEEIALLKQQQDELRHQIKEIEQAERLKAKKKCDIASKLKNASMLDYIFPYYDNVYDEKRKNIGKVHLRHNRYLSNHFTEIRALAKSITHCVSFSKRSDGWVEQSTVKKNLKELDDEELRLVVECADEIIAVLYKYKKLCEEHQSMDYSEFVLEE